MPETRGRIVPQSTTATTPIRSRFWSTNAPSRETGATGCSPPPATPDLAASSTTENVMETNRKARNHGPMALIANVCTDGTSPHRTMKVPKTTNINAQMNITKYQVLSMTHVYVT